MQQVQKELYSFADTLGCKKISLAFFYLPTPMFLTAV